MVGKEDQVAWYGLVKVGEHVEDQPAGMVTVHKKLALELQLDPRGRMNENSDVMTLIKEEDPPPPSQY